MERIANPNYLTPRERTFYARLGAMALASMLVVTPVAIKSNTSPKRPKIKTETEASPFDKIEGLEKLGPAMKHVATYDNVPESEPVTEEELVLEVPKAETAVEAQEVPAETHAQEAHVQESPETHTPGTQKTWDGPILDAEVGHIDGPTGDETYYNLPMDEIVARMHRLGVKGDYWEREDGVKMFGDYVMVAANLTTHPRGSIVETSLGTGIVCDTGGFAKDHPQRLDIATNWE